MEINFSKWIHFIDEKAYSQFGFVPGIYVIAYSEENIAGKDFAYIKEIVYFGMTNSKNGLHGRLKQFDDTIYSKQKQHGGADRFIYNLNKEDRNWKEKLYVSTIPFIRCDVSSNLPNDLIIMGDIARQEWVCQAEYVKKYNRLPRFNDKKNSPKKDRK
jgi:hypothetical protein